MKPLWHFTTMAGGPLDGATVCVPLRHGRIEHWIWAHECIVWDSESRTWSWAHAHISGFYELKNNSGSHIADSEDLGSGQEYLWQDLRLGDDGVSLFDWEANEPRWEFGD